MKIFIEDTSGSRFECDVDLATQIARLAADFFESMGWTEIDGTGSRKRAVVELVQKTASLLGKKNKRLKSDQTLAEANIQEGAVLRIFPEAMAGAVDPKLRMTALTADYRDLEALRDNDENLDFEADEYAPAEYKLSLSYESFVEPALDGQRPKVSDDHTIEILLDSDYPLVAPSIRWITPIFHPNIDPKERTVCLGQIKDQYLPGMGLARIVGMLIDMIQWRNFDIYNAFNRDAAIWAANPSNWKYIESIGGYPFQIPWHQIINPNNWGAYALQRSPFHGIEQPEYLKIAWDDEKKRARTSFTKIK